MIKNDLKRQGSQEKSLRPNLHVLNRDSHHDRFFNALQSQKKIFLSCQKIKLNSISNSQKKVVADFIKKYLTSSHKSLKRNENFHKFVKTPP